MKKSMNKLKIAGSGAKKRDFSLKTVILIY